MSGLVPGAKLTVALELAVADAITVIAPTVISMWFPPEKRGLPPILSDGWEQAYPLASAHFRRLADYPAFAPDVRPYLHKLEK